MLRFLVLLSILIGYTNVFGQTEPEIRITDGDFNLLGKQVTYYIDTLPNENLNQILTKPFSPNYDNVLNLGMHSEAVWIKLKITNQTKDSIQLIDIENSNIDLVMLYQLHDSTLILKGSIGDAIPYNLSDRYRNDPFPVFNLHIKEGETNTYFLKVINREPIILPLYLGSEQSIVSKIQVRELFFGIYTGVMIVMFLYNLFIFISLRTRMYLLYVIYISLIYLAQSNFLGYTNKYFFYNFNNISNVGSYVFPAFVIIQGLIFISVFLNIKRYTPKVKYVFFAFISLSSFAIFLALSGYLEISFYLLQPVAGLSAMFIMVLCIIHIRLGSRQAKFLLAAWSFFFVGVIVWVLKNLGIIEHHFLTNYSMPIGSALETVLLSFALADRINTLKNEQEAAQRLMLDEMRKNRTLTENINKELEIQVTERTKTLEITNRDLKTTLANLKSTQSQLVESEKMASLGQLTAGIAHEINNPINFVSSNIAPLRNDLKDLLFILNQYRENALNSKDNGVKKILEQEEELDLNIGIKEIELLVSGIEEGAKRTSEIVTSLKNFSRTDEEEFKLSDVNSGLHSTVTILKSQLRNIDVQIELNEIPKINCHLGKLNQVFMNIIDNSIDAIRLRWGETGKGSLSITSSYIDKHIKIRISDNGFGIPEEALGNIFDPFYTTKEVGKGTGLGLSISYGIIEKHKGKIEVKSAPNFGTTFIIEIPNNY